MNHCRFRALDTKGQSDNAVCYSSLTTKVVLSKKNSDSVAIRLEYNGIIMAISNDADAAIIKATLTALQQLC